MGTRNSEADIEGGESAAAGNDTVESVEVGRRTTTPQRRDTTGLDLADDMFGDLDDSFDKSDVHDGRFADNSSLYGSSHAKPRSRSRQSSIIRPASRGGNTPLMSSSLNIGAFRRRAREPSILGTSRKDRPDASHITSAAHDSGGEEEDDFAPEAESTPINNRRRTRASLQKERDGSPSLPELSGSRKRKSNGAEPSDDRPEKTTRTEEPQQEVISDDDASELSSLPSPQAMPVLTGRPVTPSREDYAAPPASSDVDDNDGFWPDIRGLAKRRRRPSVTNPLEADIASNVSSPPSLTHSPNQLLTKGRGRSRARHNSPPPLTTADLANLLPKRRQRTTAPSRGGAQSDEEYDTAGMGHDQDELSYLDSRPTRRSKDKTAPAPRHGTRSKAKAPAGAEAEAAAAPASNTRSASRRKTYSRRASDKENNSDAEDEAEESMFQPLADDTFDDTGEPRVALLSAEELKEAAKKFEEVDRWELSFEVTSEPESPVGAR